MGEHGLDSSGSKSGHVVRSCNEPLLGFTKGGEFLD